MRAGHHTAHKLILKPNQRHIATLRFSRRHFMRAKGSHHARQECSDATFPHQRFRLRFIHVAATILRQKIPPRHRQHRIRRQHAAIIHRPIEGHIAPPFNEGGQPFGPIGQAGSADHPVKLRAGQMISFSVVAGRNRKLPSAGSRRRCSSSVKR